MSDQTTLRIHYDAGWNNILSVRGDGGSLDWEHGTQANWHDGNVWTLSVEPERDFLECKVLINDDKWCIGPNYKLPSGGVYDLYPHFHTEKGRLEHLHHFDTPITIYLPPSYGENKEKRYPVIYMHDGQNLFDPAASFKGEVWGVDKTIDRLVLSGKMDEVIAVGIYNRGAGRLHDFTPSHDPHFMGVGAGGGADDYMDLMIEEIIPFINDRYRTLTDRENTALMGSSLGGLISFYIARERPEVFAKVAALSSSFWWNRRNLIRRVIRRQRYIPMKIYLDAGSNDNDRETLEMYMVLRDIGYEEGSELFCHIAPRHAHSERFWGQRVHLPLQFLFPPYGQHPDHRWRREKMVSLALDET